MILARPLASTLRPILEYYCPAKQEADEVGQWLGGIPMNCGVDEREKVERIQLAAYLECRHPNGKPIFDPDLPPPAGTNLGFTFALPKSISLRYFMANKSDRYHIAAAIRRAVEDVLTIALPSLLLTRMAKKAPSCLSLPRCYGAVFLHTTSRRNEPHLHAHLLWNSTFGFVTAHRTDWIVSKLPKQLLEHEQKLAIGRFFSLRLMRHLNPILPGELYFKTELHDSPVASVAISREDEMRHSSGRRTILAAMETHPPPPGFSRVAWSNYLNERLRPTKAASKALPLAYEPPRLVPHSQRPPLPPLAPSIPLPKGVTKFTPSDSTLIRWIAQRMREWLVDHKASRHSQNLLNLNSWLLQDERPERVIKTWDKVLLHQLHSKNRLEQYFIAYPPKKPQKAVSEGPAPYRKHNEAQRRFIRQVILLKQKAQSKGTTAQTGYP